LLRLVPQVAPASDREFRQLIPSGYLVVDRAPLYLICDVAPIGPDHLPAHAHADTLSFELSFLGQRVLVNSGTSEYGMGPERQRQRGTAAHNTVVIDGQNSSEVWAGFRVARRARVHLLRAAIGDEGVIIIAEHDGYRRLPGANIHRREWRIDASGLRVRDLIEGPFGAAECRYHLHPKIEVCRAEDPGTWLLRLAGGELQMRFDGARSVELLETTWHPEFGRSVPSRCVVAHFDGSRLDTSILWVDSR
jgi:uncharacterized heparinase superfamily protein